MRFALVAAAMAALVSFTPAQAAVVAFSGNGDGGFGPNGWRYLDFDFVVMDRQGNLTPFELFDGALKIPALGLLVIATDNAKPADQLAKGTVVAFDYKADATFTFGDLDQQTAAAISAAFRTQSLLPGGIGITPFNGFVLRAGNSEVFVDNVAIGLGEVPEPANWAMMIAGFGLAGGAARRRRQPSVSYA